MDPYLGFLILVPLILISSLLTALEISIASLGRVRVRALLKEHPTHRALLQNLLNHPSLTIAAIGFVKDLIIVLSALIAWMTVTSLFPQLGFVTHSAITTGFVILYLLFLGEFFPKHLAREQTGGWVLKYFRVVRLIDVIFVPILRISHNNWNFIRRIFGLSKREEVARSLPVSEDQIKYLLEAAEEYGLLDEEEERMIWRILAYDDLVVRQVMVPRPEVISFPVDTSIKEARETIEEHGFSRYPVYEGTRDNIIGVLYAKDLLRFGLSERVVLKDLVRQPFFTPTIKPINDLLREFQRNKKHIAIVVDEFGSMAGLVTLEDILEEIVGEITDEYDQPETPIRKLSSQEYLVDGDTELSQINEELLLSLPIDGAVTVGGLITQELEEIPRAGRTVSMDGISLVVEKATAREILKVRVKLPEPMSAQQEQT